MFYLSICILSVVACKSDVPVTDEEKLKLYGDWALEEAVRDGNLTKIMDGALFTIDSATFKTNLFGSDETFTYDRQGNTIILSGSDGQALNINKSTNDTLILDMKRNSKKYQMLLQKVNSMEVKE